MMKINDARQLGLRLFECGFTPWLAETGDGYIIRMIIEGEMIDVFSTDVQANQTN